MGGAAGRISIAISIILMGGFGLWSSVASIPIRSDAAYLAEIDAQFTRLPVGSGAQQVSPEMVARLRLLMREVLVLWRKLWAVPAIRIMLWLSVILNAAALVAGFGWLGGRQWAARLGLMQAVVFLPFAVVSWWPLSLTLSRMRELVLANFHDLPNFGPMATWLAGAQSALLWTNTLMLLGWNGFLVWYFRRAQRQVSHV